MKTYIVQPLSNDIKSGFVCVDEKENVMNNNILPANDAQLFADLYNKIAEMQVTLDGFEAEHYNNQQNVLLT